MDLPAELDEYHHGVVLGGLRSRTDFGSGPAWSAPGVVLQQFFNQVEYNYGLVRFR